MSEEFVQGWLPAKYDYEAPKRGQIRRGVVFGVAEDGVMVDVGLKWDGFVPAWDLQRLSVEDAASVRPGAEVVTRIVRPTADDRVQLSLYQALSERDWDRAEEMLESGEVWRGVVTGCNSGGITTGFGQLRAFIPASHLWERVPRNITSDERDSLLGAYVGRELAFRVIEVDRRKDRLILSERATQRELHKADMARLLDELRVGEIRHGQVRAIKPFGVFVDIGGADGLVHLSELAWRRVRRPEEVVHVGEELDVQVVSVDKERERIGLSLKRTSPNPWEVADMLFFEGQLVDGCVTNLADFGAFVALKEGIEGLIHISELSDPAPAHPSEVVQPGQELVLRVLRVDALRERMALSLMRVDDEEREAWLAESGKAPATEIVVDEGVALGAEEPYLGWVPVQEDAQEA